MVGYESPYGIFLRFEKRKSANDKKVKYFEIRHASLKSDAFGHFASIAEARDHIISERERAE